MADINALVTLGVGTPASIKWLLTLGLNIGAQVIIIADPDNVAYASWRDRRTSAIWRDKRAAVEWRDKRTEAE